MNAIKFCTIQITFAFCVAFLFVLSTSCNRREENKIKEITIRGFPVEQRLESNEVGFDELSLIIGTVDTLLLFVNPISDKKVCIYYPKEQEIIGRFGRAGKGPGEFIYEPLYFGQYFVRDGQKVWLYDLNSRLLRLFNVNSSIGNNVKSVEKKILVPSSIISCGSVFFINDSCIAGTSRSAEAQFFVYNPIKETTFLYNFYPQKDNRSDESFIDLFEGSARIRPDLTQLVCAYKYFNRIDIFDIKKREIVSICVPKDGENELSDNLILEDLRSHEYGYYDLFLTNNFIYALKNNCSWQSKRDGDYTSEIHVFFWNGDPVCKYKLSDPVESFVVIEKNRKIYGGHYFTKGALSEFSY